MRALLLCFTLLFACLPKAPPSPPPPEKVSCDDWERPQVAGRVEPDDLDEISGIAVSRLNPGVLWVHEDSGNEPVLFALSLSGELLGRILLEGVENIDWEDIAIGPCGDSDCLFIGDIGDNAESRDDVSILRIEEPLLDGSKGVSLTATPSRFRFQYPGGPRDAESLAIAPEGLPIILSKRLDGTAEIFLMPVLDEEQITPLLFLGEISTTQGNTGLVAAATAADLSPDGSRLLVRTYLFGWEFRFPRSILEGGQPERVETPVAFELQGEAIAYDPILHGFWQVGEGKNPPLHFISCLRL